MSLLSVSQDPPQDEEGFYPWVDRVFELVKAAMQNPIAAGIVAFLVVDALSKWQTGFSETTYTIYGEVPRA